MKTEKIKALADFIDSIPPKRFNISNWVSEIFGQDYSYYRSSEILDVNVCKTAGCIAGWAMALECGGFVRIPEVTQPSHAKEIALAGAGILGLSYEEAARIFYVDEESVWVEYFDMYRDLLDYDVESEIDWSYENGLCDYLSDNRVIDNKVAAFMLRKIANGEVEL